METLLKMSKKCLNDLIRKRAKICINEKLNKIIKKWIDELINNWINKFINKCKDEVRGVNGAGLHTLDVDNIIYIGNH